MKRSAKVMSFVLACALTPAIVPEASAQTQTANPETAPAGTPTPQQKQSQQQTPSRQQQNTQGTLIGLRVRQQEPQSEPLRATLPPARSSELGIPVGSREGPTGTASKDLKDGRV
jgi:hypothetical protein